MIGKVKVFFGTIIGGVIKASGFDQTISNMLHGIGLFISDFCVVDVFLVKVTDSFYIASKLRDMNLEISEV